MRHRIALISLAIGLPMVTLATAADALPGIDGVSVNRGPVSVHRTVERSPVGAVRRSAPATRRSDPQADRRREERRRRARLVARWQGVANCESGGNWSTDTGNGYYGGLQFSLETWRAYGGRGMPDERPAWYQSTVAERVRTRSGLHHWPHCGQYYRG